MKLVDFKVVLDYFVSQSGYHDMEICIFINLGLGDRFLKLTGPQDGPAGYAAG